MHDECAAAPVSHWVGVFILWLWNMMRPYGRTVLSVNCSNGPRFAL
jgi:hypothetical protein